MESAGLWYSQHYSRLGGRDGPLPLPAHQNPALLLARSSEAGFPPYNQSLLRAAHSSLQHTPKSPFASYPAQEEAAARFKETEYRNSFMHSSLTSNSVPPEGGPGGSPIGSSMWFNSAPSPWRHHSGIMAPGPFGLLPHEAIMARGSHILERGSRPEEPHQSKSNLSSPACMEQNLAPGGYRSILPSPTCPSSFVEQAPNARTNVASSQNNPYLSSMNDAYYSYLKSGFQAYKSYSSNLELTASTASSPYCYSQSLYSPFEMSSMKHESNSSLSLSVNSPPNINHYGTNNSVIVNRSHSVRQNVAAAPNHQLPNSMYGHNDMQHNYSYASTKPGYSPNPPSYIPGYSMAGSPTCSNGPLDFQSYGSSMQGRMGTQTPGYPPMSTPIPASTPSHPALQVSMDQAYIPCHDPHTPSTPASPPKPPDQISSPPSVSHDHNSIAGSLQDSTYPLSSSKKIPPLHPPTSLNEESLSNPASLSSEESNHMLPPPLAHHQVSSAIPPFLENHIMEKPKVISPPYKDPYENVVPQNIIKSAPSVIYHNQQDHYMPDNMPKPQPSNSNHLMDERSYAYSDNSIGNSECDVKESDCSLPAESSHPLENFHSNCDTLDSYSNKVPLAEPNLPEQGDSKTTPHYPDSSNSSWVNSNGRSVDDKVTDTPHPAEAPKSESTYGESEYSKSEDECCLDLSHKICQDIEDDLDFLAELPSEATEVDGNSQKEESTPKATKEDPKEGFLQSFLSFFDENNPVPAVSPSLGEDNKTPNSDLGKSQSAKPKEKEEDDVKKSEKEPSSTSQTTSESNGEALFNSNIQKVVLPNPGTASFSSDEEDNSINGFSSTVALAIQRLNEDCDGKKNSSDSNVNKSNNFDTDEENMDCPPKKNKVEDEKSSIETAKDLTKSESSESIPKSIESYHQSPRKKIINRCKEAASQNQTYKILSSKNQITSEPYPTSKPSSDHFKEKINHFIEEDPPNKEDSHPERKGMPVVRKRKIKFLKRNCIEGSWILEGHFRTGDFLIAVADVSKPQAPIWRLEGKSLLHKFHACQMGGKSVHMSSMQYTAWRPATRSRYAGLTVRVLPTTAANGKMVVESLGLTGQSSPSDLSIQNGMNSEKTVHSQRENFEAFLSLLVKQVLDPEIGKKNSAMVKEESIRSYQVEERLQEKQQVLLKRNGAIAWSSSLKQCADRYPSVSVVVATGKEKRKAVCQVCHKNPGHHVVQFHGRPYDPETLKTGSTLPPPTASGGTVATRFSVCSICVQAVSVYSRLAHARHHFYHRCHAKVNKVRCQTKESHLVHQRCLQDKDWMDQMFQELVDLWSASDKLR